MLHNPRNKLLELAENWPFMVNVFVVVAITLLGSLTSFFGLSQAMQLLYVGASAATSAVVALLVTAVVMYLSYKGHALASSPIKVVAHSVSLITAAMALVAGGLVNDQTAYSASDSRGQVQAQITALETRLADTSGLLALANTEPNVAAVQAKFDRMKSAKRDKKGAIIWEVTGQCMRTNTHPVDCSQLLTAYDAARNAQASQVASIKAQLGADLTALRQQISLGQAGTEASVNPIALAAQRYIASSSTLAVVYLVMGIVIAAGIELLIYTTLFALTTTTATSAGHESSGSGGFFNFRPTSDNTQREDMGDDDDGYDDYVHDPVTRTDLQDLIDVVRTNAPTPAEEAPKGREINQEWFMLHGMTADMAGKAVQVFADYAPGGVVSKNGVKTKLSMGVQTVVDKLLDPMVAMGLITKTANDQGHDVYNWVLKPALDAIKEA